MFFVKSEGGGRFLVALTACVMFLMDWVVYKMFLKEHIEN